MNFTVVTGRLGKDAETRFTPSNQKVTSFTIARNKKKGGQDVTIWHNITLWGDQFDNILPYLKKGSAITVIGDLDLRKYKDKQGVDQVSLDVTGWKIEFPPSSQKAAGDSTGGFTASSEAAAPAYASHKPSFNQGASYTQMGGDSDDEPLPF